MAKLTQDLKACPEGAIHPVQYHAGDDVTGRVAEIAEAMGIVEGDKPKKKFLKKAPETK